MYKFKTLINGELYENNKELEIINPVDNSIAGTVPSLTKQDIDNAFISAKQAQKQ
ncbi:hypothetical protein JIY74_30910 [Vibrio harveyi]|nr:hypothetical protein [Vibrio harveyi]